MLGEVLPGKLLVQWVIEEAGRWRDRIYSPLSTLVLFIEQVLSADHSCTDAVARGVSARVALGQDPCSLNSGPYCKARARLRSDVGREAVGQSVGERVLMDDGALEARITKIEGDEVHTEMVVGGVLEARKGVNLPDVVLPLVIASRMRAGDVEVATLSMLASVGGALDVTLAPVAMKKGRPGLRLEALAPEASLPDVLDTLFVHTSTIGARWWRVERAVLAREEEVVEWRGQRIRRKRVRLPDGTTRAKPEYDDVVAAARALGLPPLEVRTRLDEERSGPGDPDGVNR